MLIAEFIFLVYVKRDGLEFSVNVKEFWTFLTREKAKYFCMTEF